MSAMHVSLHYLEHFSKKHFLPITLPRQIAFTNVEQVRSYVKKWGHNHIIAQEDPDVLMTLMMEVFFGHYNTSRLNHKELISMWKKLMLTWIDTLSAQSELLVPKNEQGNTANYDKYVIEMEKTFNNEYELHTFYDRHRTKNNIALIVSDFTFTQLYRFYMVPLHLQPELVKQYVALHNSVIEAWYDIVKDYPDVIRRVQPASYLDPKAIATKIFGPDLCVPTEVLQKKKNAFLKWWNRESAIGMELAAIQNDTVFVESRKREWEQAKVYATLLHNALVPRSKLEDKKQFNYSDFDDEFVDSGDTYIQQVNERF
jgi:hypothetical protein